MAISLEDLSRKLPIGVQSFEDLRTNNCLYVDKTDYVYFLANSGTKSYFLARPRRFGKSLFANTLRTYFEGKKECFKKLKIDSLEKDWIKYPIAYFDFVDGDYTEGIHILKDKLASTLEDFEKCYGITCDKNTLPERFKTDLTLVYQKTGLKTVIIVDEYDNPLIKSNDLGAAKEIYRSFFAVLKSADAFIRFAFITGVTKFAKTSIFSGTNQPEDITDNEKFSAICGITHEELIANFTPEIEKLAKKQGFTFDECIAELKRWYDSYLFHEDGEKVFNPVSLLNCFSSRDFQNFWYDTGNPAILMKRIHSTYYDFKRFENDVEYPKDDLKTFKNDEHNMDLVPLLYYTGYLTIKSYDRKTRTYILGFPNNEIKLSFLQGLINEKDYAGRFKMDGRKIIKVGVNFSSKEKNITEWKVEE